MSVQGHEAGKKRGEAKSVGEQMNWAGIITGHAPLGPERAGRLPVRELIRLLSKLHQISPKLLPRWRALPSIRCRRLPRFSAPQKGPPRHRCAHPRRRARARPPRRREDAVRRTDHSVQRTQQAGKRVQKRKTPLVRPGKASGNLLDDPQSEAFHLGPTPAHSIVPANLASLC